MKLAHLGLWTLAAAAHLTAGITPEIVGGGATVVLCAAITLTLVHGQRAHTLAVTAAKEREVREITAHLDALADHIAEIGAAQHHHLSYLRGRLAERLNIEGDTP